MPLSCLAVIFTLCVVEFNDQMVFRDILPERLMRLLVNKLDLISATIAEAQTFDRNKNVLIQQKINEKHHGCFLLKFY